MSDDDDVPRDTSPTSPTDVSDTRSRVDLSAWLTKQQAADAIGVSTKAIERFTQAGKLEQRFRPQAHGPKVAVYFPEDVARLASARQPGAPPFVLPAVPDVATGNGKRPAAAAQQIVAFAQRNGALTGASDDPLRAFAAAVYAAVMSQTSETSRPETLYVTIREASAITGLTQAYLRRQIQAQTLPAIRDVGWRIRRKDLEQL